MDGGSETLAALEESLSNPNAAIQLCVRVAETCGRIAGDDAIALLLVRMDTEDRRLRTTILQALGRADYRATSAHRGNIDDILWQELGGAAWVMAAILDTDGEALQSPCAVPLNIDCVRFGIGACYCSASPVTPKP